MFFWIVYTFVWSDACSIFNKCHNLCHNTDKIFFFPECISIYLPVVWDIQNEDGKICLYRCKHYRESLKHVDNLLVATKRSNLFEHIIVCHPVFFVNLVLVILSKLRKKILNIDALPNPDSMILRVALTNCSLWSIITNFRPVLGWCFGS